MTATHRLVVGLALTIALVVSGLMVAAWPGSSSPDPIVTPTTYGYPGPTGGPTRE